MFRFSWNLNNFHLNVWKWNQNCVSWCLGFARIQSKREEQFHKCLGEFRLLYSWELERANLRKREKPLPTWKSKFKEKRKNLFQLERVNLRKREKPLPTWKLEIVNLIKRENPLPAWNSKFKKKRENLFQLSLFPFSSPAPRAAAWPAFKLQILTLGYCVTAGWIKNEVVQLKKRKKEWG